MVIMAPPSGRLLKNMWDTQSDRSWMKNARVNAPEAMHAVVHTHVSELPSAKVLTNNTMITWTDQLQTQFSEDK